MPAEDRSGLTDSLSLSLVLSVLFNSDISPCFPLVYTYLWGFNMVVLIFLKTYSP